MLLELTHKNYSNLTQISYKRSTKDIQIDQKTLLKITLN